MASASKTSGSLYSSRPLAVPARVLVALGATAVALLFYLYALVCVLGILILLAVLAVLALILLRVGMARLVSGGIMAQFQLMAALLMSMWRWKDRTRRLELQAEDAPPLLVLTGNVADRVGAARPSAILLEMGAGAAVQLLGHRRRTGRSVLILGYDLVTALGRDELEAVIGHEMAHARLVQRGYQGWLFNALRRIGAFVHMADWALEQAREAGTNFYTARAVRLGANLAGWGLTRLVAALSREGEFAADRLAGEVCGGEVLGRALLRTVVTGHRSEEVSWRERVVQAQRGPGFCDWLRGRLTPETEEEQRRMLRRVLDEERASDFDTHPRIVDRLQALGCRPEMDLPPPGEPASGLVRDADRLAEALILHQREQEAAGQRQEWKKAARDLRRQYRGQNRELGRLIVLALVLAALGGLLIFGGVVGGVTELLVAGAIALGIAFVAVWLGARSRYHPRQVLPSPPVALWEAAMAAQPEARMRVPDIRQIEAELEASLPPDARDRKRRREHWARVCCDALAGCDYVRGLAAGRLAVRAHKHSMEGLLALAVGAAYLGDETGSGQALGTALQQFGANACVCWGTAWTYFMLGEWSAAGPWLFAAVEQRPDEATLCSLLGRSQWRAGHLHEALRSLERAAALEPDEPRHRFPLVEVLLDLSRPADADPHVGWLQHHAPKDYRVLVAAFRIALLLGRSEEAHRREEAVLAAAPGTAAWMSLGRAYMDAREYEDAERCLTAVRACGHFPEALLGLGRIAALRGDAEMARGCLTAALDLTRPPAVEAKMPLAVIPGVCMELLRLNEPVEGCSAWHTIVPLTPLVDGACRLNLVIQAPDLEAAGAYARWFCGCLYPGRESPVGALPWKPVGIELPPESRLRPGVAACWPE